MASMLSPFGLECRIQRLQRGWVLGDQAKILGCSVAFISAVERGEKAVPKSWPKQISEWFDLNKEESFRLTCLAVQTRKSIEVFPNNSYRAEIAQVFAQVLNTMSVENLDRINTILSLETADEQVAS